MPEVRLRLEWPDGQSTEFYSPSTVVYEFLQPGEELSVAELGERGLLALQAASERVRARYGFACSRTDEEAVRLQALLDRFQAQERVRVQERLRL
jgi:uncharacterized repeat protein (TIGR04042 family)